MNMMYLIINATKYRTYIFTVHQHQTVEFDRFVVRRSVGGEPDIGQWGILLFQLHTENVDVFPRRVQNVH